MTALEKALSGDAPLKGAMLWLVAIVLAGANFIAVLDMTIANVSVPNIAGALGISSSQGMWVITCYAVAEAITVPLTGWLAGRFGAVRVFTTAIAMFGVFSALCGFAPNLRSAGVRPHPAGRRRRPADSAVADACCCASSRRRKPPPRRRSGP